MSEKAAQPSHRRLSEALCEAVEFGRPTRIRMGMDDWFQLLASIDAANGWVDLASDKFEDVPIEREPNFKGCVVEHDNRYIGLMTPGEPRDNRKPAIVAW